MAIASTSLRAANILNQLQECGVTHIVWLPDSETGYMYKAMLDSALKVVPVCREGESMAIAAGLVMGGKKPVVLIQSTGFFESGDSIRGLCLDLHLPILLMLGYRGYAGPDMPPQDSAARFLEPILDAWGIPHYTIASDESCHYVSDAFRRAQSDQHPAAVLIAREFSE